MLLHTPLLLMARTRANGRGEAERVRPISPRRAGGAVCSAAGVYLACVSQEELLSAPEGDLWLGVRRTRAQGRRGGKREGCRNRNL